MKRLINVLIGLALTICTLGLFFLIAETIMHVFQVSIPPKSGYVITLPGPFGGKDNPDHLIGAKGPKLHPYLGLTNPSYKDRSKDQYGTPVVLKESTCNIGIFGGSVAMYFGEYEKAHKNIINRLANKYRESRCQTFKIVNIAMHGGMAPMTLYAFIHNLDIIDATIVIDGYNEVGTAWLDDPRNYPIDYPPYYYYIDFLYLSSKKVEQDTFEIQFYKKLYKTIDKYSNAYLMKKSRFLKYLSHRVLSKLGTQIMDLTDEKAKETYWTKTKGPPAFVNPDNMRGLRQEIWKKTVFLIQKIGRLYSIPVIHILQPIPDPARKLLTASEEHYLEETRRFIPFYEPYGRLIEELAELGVTVHDFRTVFKDYKGSAYRDPIHFTEDGNEIVAKKVVELIDQTFPHEFPGRHKIRVDFSTILNEREQ